MWVYLLALLAIVNGGWMIFDGQYVMRFGKYFGPEIPGPWRMFPEMLGVDPFSMGPLFVGLGLIWLFLGYMIWSGRGPVCQFLAILAVLTLWYLPVGTFISVVCLVMLWTGVVTKFADREPMG